MKVGDYVRTDKGISKIYMVYKQFILITTNYKQVMNEDIIKSSPNIVDLLQPMDLMYIDISPDNCGGIVVPRIPETYCELEQIINEIKLGNYVLKGIVTKEQLMENMYKVESEVN